MKNPLIRPILSILRNHPNGVGEFYILKTLKEQIPELSNLADNANLQLFRLHFLIMNALYQLQASLWQEEQLSLSITALHICLLPQTNLTSSSSNEINDSTDAKLAAYYLDWNEYEKTNENDVSKLLNSFYRGSHNQEERNAALDVLMIEEKNPSKDDIKRQYRKLAHQAHPDHGGDSERFISLREAYECLMYSYV